MIAWLWLFCKLAVFCLSSIITCNIMKIFFDLDKEQLLAGQYFQQCLISTLIILYFFVFLVVEYSRGRWPQWGGQGGEKWQKRKKKNDHTMADFAGSLAVFLSGPSPMIVWPCQWLNPAFEIWFITQNLKLLRLLELMLKTALTRVTAWQ